MPRAARTRLWAVALSVALAACGAQPDDSVAAPDGSAAAAFTSSPIVGVPSQRCVDLNAASTANGTAAQLWDCNGQTNQSFTYGADKQLVVYGNKCLQPSGGATTNGTAVVIGDCAGQAAQQWNVNADGTITSVQSGLCMDANAAGTANGTKIILWTCGTGSNQRWTVSGTNPGTTYTLSIAASGNGSTTPAPGTYSYDAGTAVTVTATPAVGATFAGWSGAASGAANPVTITLDGNKALTATFTGGSSGGGGGRTVRNFNQSWKFLRGDYAGAEAPGYNDAAWEPVGLPHSFSLPYFMWTQFYSGYGWYRKHLDVPAEWAGKRVFLEFQAAFQDAQVYVNGVQVGRHLGGYNGFSFDVTSRLVAGDNVVAVRLNNNWNPQLAPRGGDHTFSGGIYRDVYLVVTDPLHVTWYGTFVTTPTLAANAGASSTVNVKTELRNDRASSTTYTLRTDILDPGGAVVATVSTTQAIAANATVTVDQTTPAVSRPSLWHPDHPTLYRAVSVVSDATGEVDRFTTTFGFRWISWSATNGFSLNGSRYYLHGANLHQDQAGWGDAVTDAAIYRDVKMVKDAGLNFIRGSHYPKDPAFSEACDQLGVLFWSENAFWGSAAYGEGTWDTAGAYPANAADQAPFETSVLNSLTEMIRIHRNHPSVIAWSMSNEPYFTAGSTINAMRALLTKEVNLSHQLDPTRPAAIGGAQRPTDSTRIDKLGDIAGYNGDGATLSIFQNPGVASVVSEYNNPSSTRPGSYDPGWADLNQQLTNGFPTEFPWRSGQAIWCMFDHGTIKGSGLATMGLVDYFRVPKRGWYWYRNAYAKVPPPAWPVSGTPAGLRLAASTTNLTAVDGTQDALVTVTVVDSGGRALSNTVPVTLTVTSGPGEFPTGPSITFRPPSTDPQSDIVIRDGQAAIAFRTYYSGTSVITATSPGLASASVTITSQGTPAWVPGVTPPAPTRAYSRFSGSGTPTTTFTLALNHPTSASSTAATTTSAAANDGNTGTSWLASSTSASQWWQVNLEVSYSINTLEVTFPAPGNWRYTIAVSQNGTSWTTVVDESQSTSTAQTRRATGSFGSSIQYVRVNYVGLPAGQPAGLAELVVGGTSASASYSLTVNRSGTGSGTVAGGGIDCGSVCNAVYVSGTSVTLTAAAAAGSTFTGWSGACSGASPTCTVGMTAARTVTAGFNAGGTTVPLTVTKSGTGAGTVRSSTGGIDCGSVCSATVASGTAVTLTATAAAGSTFGGWSGACAGTGTCVVTMTAAQSVTATFSPSEPPPPGGISINAGGAAAGGFVADAYFTGGSTYSTTSAIDTTQLAGTPPPPAVFQTERYGEFTYTVPNLTAGSPYSVTLYFAESYWTAAGQRTFNVAANGATVLAAFDIFAAAGGANRAVARSFSTTANASGQVVIQFTRGGGPDNPKLCGLAVATSAPPPPPPPPSAVSVNAGGAAAGTFVADAYFSGGSTYATTNAIDTSQVPGDVPPQAVFQTERYGESTYTIPNRTAGSAQTVTLYFQESYWTAAGQRTFNVAINGSNVLTAFDIFAAAGGTNRAIARTFTTTANASGQVVIQLAKGGGPDNPKICGIKITSP